MAREKHNQHYYSADQYGSRGISIKVDIKDAFPDIWAAMPEKAIEVLKQTAEVARAQHESETPMSVGGGTLRHDTRIVGYQKGNLGGTVYLQWNARNPKDGYHYAYVQEEGGYGDVYFTKYSTPGTGPYFMNATYETIRATIAQNMAEATRDLVKENHV